MHQLKENRKMVLIVMDHKQKVIQMKSLEGQAEYYRKSRVSFLGTMQVLWKVRPDGTSVFEFRFVDYAFRGYSAQNNVQVVFVLKYTRNCFHIQNLEMEEIVFQSDNMLCLESQELNPFMYHINVNQSIYNPLVNNWILTEAQTGRGQLDTQFPH